jgi:predicted RecA/RadA family phage recombinase
MRKMIRTLRHFVLTPLLFCAAQASAAGINLGWNDCPGGATYSLTQTFACDTNAGIHTLVGSFVAPAGVEMMSANEIVIDVQTGGARLSAWWTYGTGQCRTASSLQGNFDFTAGPFTCYDYWQGGAIGALSWSIPAASANRCRIKGVFALPSGDSRATSIPEGTHVYSFKIILSNVKTTGLGACAGCSDEACLVLNTITINQPAPQPPRIQLTNPAPSAFVTWQGWSTIDPANNCPDVTPTRSRTWGSIKALYR